MAKVAIIGAGSLVFTKQFLNDMFNTPPHGGQHLRADGTYYVEA